MNLEVVREQVKNSRNVNDRTLSIYMNNIKRVLLKNGFNPNDFRIDDVVEYTEDIIDNILKLEVSIHSKKNLLIGMNILLSPTGKRKPKPKHKEAYDMFTNTLKKLQSEYTDKKRTQVKNKRETKNWVPYDKLMDIFNKKYKRAYNMLGEDRSREKNQYLKDTLIVGLYLLQPPRRLEYVYVKYIFNDSYDSLIDKDKMDNHYIVMTNNQNYFFSFGGNKTKIKTLKPVLVPCNRRLNALIDEMYTDNSHVSEYLLNYKDNKPINTNTLARNIKRIFKPHTGKSIGVNLLRHIYISHKLRNDTSLSTREKLAEEMNHSTTIQETVYRKLEDS